MIPMRDIHFSAAGSLCLRDEAMMMAAREARNRQEESAEEHSRDSGINDVKG
jgi:hypothetical protein